MVRVLVKNILEKSGSTDVGGNIAAAFRRAEKRESVEAGDVDIIGIFCVERGHEIGVLEVAFVLGAFAIENFDGAEIVFFALGFCFGEAFCWSGGKFL